MHKVSDDQIDFILNDIESRGIVLEDLRDNLLDHICCIIEHEMRESEDFEEFYESTLPRFFEKGLSEIQEETDNLLRFKNFYSMKRTLKISGIATVLLMTVGAILKTLHLPGAGIMLVSGGFLLSLLFLPLLIILKMRDSESLLEKLVFSFGFLLAIVISMGVIFKLQHWPMANMLMIGGTATFTFLFVPIYFFTRIRKPEHRFNTIVNAVLMMTCGGMFFSLFDLSYSYTYQKQMQDTYVYLQNNIDRLNQSNERIYQMTKDGSVQNIQDLGDQLATNIGSLTLKIEEKNSTANIGKAILQIQEGLGLYNQEIARLKIEGMEGLDPEEFAVMHRLRVPLALDLLSRAQLSLSINENVLLSQASHRISSPVL